MMKLVTLLTLLAAAACGGPFHENADYTYRGWGFFDHTNNHPLVPEADHLAAMMDCFENTSEFFEADEWKHITDIFYTVKWEPKIIDCGTTLGCVGTHNWNNRTIRVTVSDGTAKLQPWTMVLAHEITHALSHERFGDGDPSHKKRTAMWDDARRINTVCGIRPDYSKQAAYTLHDLCTHDHD